MLNNSIFVSSFLIDLEFRGDERRLRKCYRKLSSSSSSSEQLKVESQEPVKKLRRIIGINEEEEKNEPRVMMVKEDIEQVSRESSSSSSASSLFCDHDDLKTRSTSRLHKVALKLVSFKKQSNRIVVTQQTRRRRRRVTVRHVLASAAGVSNEDGCLEVDVSIISEHCFLLAEEHNVYATLNCSKNY